LWGYTYTRTWRREGRAGWLEAGGADRQGRGEERGGRRRRRKEEEEQQQRRQQQQ